MKTIVYKYTIYLIFVVLKRNFGYVSKQVGRALYLGWYYLFDNNIVHLMFESGSVVLVLREPY